MSRITYLLDIQLNSADEFRNTLDMLRTEAQALHKASNQASRAVGLAVSSIAGFQHMLDRKQLPSDHDYSPARMAWIRAINRVLILNYIEKVRARLDRMASKEAGAKDDHGSNTHLPHLSIDHDNHSSVESKSSPSSPTLPPIINSRAAMLNSMSNSPMNCGSFGPTKAKKPVLVPRQIHPFNNATKAEGDDTTIATSTESTKSEDSGKEKTQPKAPPISHTKSHDYHSAVGAFWIPPIEKAASHDTAQQKLLHSKSTPHHAPVTHRTVANKADHSKAALKPSAVASTFEFQNYDMDGDDDLQSLASVATTTRGSKRLGGNQRTRYGSRTSDQLSSLQTVEKAKTKMPSIDIHHKFTPSLTQAEEQMPRLKTPGSNGRSRRATTPSPLQNAMLSSHNSSVHAR